MNSNQSILIGDDQAGVLEALRLLLKSEGYRTVTVDSPAGVLGAAAKQRFDRRAPADGAKLTIGRTSAERRGTGGLPGLRQMV